MNKTKESALSDWMEMIRHSWTWERLTEEERKRFCSLLSHPGCFHLRGSYMQRWDYLQDVYFAFLTALEYKPIGWRETEEVPLF